MDRTGDNAIDLKNQKRMKIRGKKQPMSCDPLFHPKRLQFSPKKEGENHVRLGFRLAGVARKTLHLKVAGIFHDSGAVLRMVSTNNLNRDVLELVFSHLNADDLCYVALVNHSFFAAATPRLYRTLFFRQKHANKFPVRHYSPRLHCLSSDF